VSQLDVGGQSYPAQRGQVELTWARDNVFGSLTNRYIRGSE
jgi:hypothetical protein